MPDDSFGKEEYQKLWALQSDGCEDMTVSEYRSRIGKLTDSAEYRSLLERFWKSQVLYELKDTDETAGFLFYVLPLTGDEWKTRNYSGEAESFYPEGSARLEYAFSLTVLDADNLTIREYDTTRLNMMRGMQDIAKDRTSAGLQDRNSLLADIQEDIDHLVRQQQTDKIGISMEYAWFQELPQNTEQEGGRISGCDAKEMRRYPAGTEEDYRSLLALKTADYQNMPVADFNSSLLEWANADAERMERIDEDRKQNDFPASLTPEELSFVKTTVFLSGMENGKQIQSIYTGTEPGSPACGGHLPEKTADAEYGKARCSLYYQFSYSLSEAKRVTVGERDSRIEKAINAVEALWNNTPIETFLKMDKDAIILELGKIAAACSTDDVTVAVDEKQVHFESMDERNIA